MGMNDPWTSPRAWLTVLALPFLSAPCLFAAYGDWSFRPYESLFWLTMPHLPWVRLSLLLTLVTCLAGIAGAHRRSRNGILSSPLMYAGVVIPFVWFVMYPGNAAVGHPYGDDAASTAALLLSLVHGVGFYQIRRAVEEAEGPLDG